MYIKEYVYICMLMADFKIVTWQNSEKYKHKIEVHENVINCFVMKIRFLNIFSLKLDKKVLI